MGSGRGRHAALICVGACAVGAPTGFSSGDRWVIPLVGSLEDGLLVVPAFVDGKGPFLFAIDPDANVSVVDEQVVIDAQLRTGSVDASGETQHMLDESDTEEPRFFAEVLEWRLGTLTVQNKPAEVVTKGTYDTAGRRIAGLIGRDIIADSLVFGFDRDLGVATLTTQKAFERSGQTYGALALSYDELVSHIENVAVVPPPRRLVKATINDVSFTLHLDLGATVSQLRESAWAKAKLSPAELHGVVIDEVGTPRTVDKEAIAEAVHVGDHAQPWGPTKGDRPHGGWTTPRVVLVPYVDKRWAHQDLDGTLGLGFFKAFKVFANWHTSMVYAIARTDTIATTAARIGRWQSPTLTACAHVGCAEVKLVDPLAGKAPGELPLHHPGVVVTFTRDPSAAAMDLEVLVAVKAHEGGPSLQWLVANLPRGADRAMTHLGADYVGATLSVVDASPFPRPCPGDGACVDLLAAPW